MPALTTVPDKSTGDVFTEQMWDVYVKDNVNELITRGGNTAVRITEVSITTPTASVVFSGFPLTYRYLWIEYVARGNVANTVRALRCQFNGDTTTNYDTQKLYGTGATAAALEGFAQTSLEVGAVIGASGAAGLFASGVIELPGYALTTQQKTVISRGVSKYGTGTGNLQVAQYGGFWRAAVSTQIQSITLFPEVNDFVDGTLFTLYGVP